MDSKLCFSEEHSRDRHGSLNGDLFEIRALDRGNTNEIADLVQCYAHFCNEVNLEPTGTIKVVVTDLGPAIVSEMEARIYGYLYSGAKVLVALSGGKVCGFLIFQQLFDKLIAIRVLWVDKKFKAHGLGKRLTSAPQPKQLVFQTRKQNEPVDCLRLTEAHRIKIFEDDHFITWTMEWKE